MVTNPIRNPLSHPIRTDVPYAPCTSRISAVAPRITPGAQSKNTRLSVVSRVVTVVVVVFDRVGVGHRVGVEQVSPLLVVERAQVGP